MKTIRLVWLAVMMALVGCGDSSGPGIDPTVQITNNTTWPVYFEWRDGQGVLGADTIPGMTRRCERFFARADSAFFYAEGQNPTSGAIGTYTVPWFDPSVRHAWTMTVTCCQGNNASPEFLVRDNQAPC